MLSADPDKKVDGLSKYREQYAEFEEAGKDKQDKPKTNGQRDILLKAWRYILRAINLALSSEQRPEDSA